MNHSTLIKLKELAKAATPGPWHVSQEYNVIQTKHFTKDIWHIAACFHSGHADASLIAAANPETILILLECIDIMDSALEYYEHKRDIGITSKEARLKVNEVLTCEKKS